MKKILSLILSLTIFGPLQAEEAKPKSPIEKHSWTLGYQPDKTVEFSQPAEGSPLKLDFFLPHSLRSKGGFKALPPNENS